MRLRPSLLILLALAAAAVWQMSRPPPAPFAAAFAPDDAFQFEPPAAGSYALPAIKAAPDGRVLAIDGQQRSLSDITRGKLSLISFVYLNCGDVDGCPLALSTLFDIHDASARIPGLRDRMQLVTISFDPARDTVEAMRAFAYPIQRDQAAAQKVEWHVLTTSGQDDLQPILAGFGQTVDPSPDQDSIAHLLRVFLVDGDGQIRNVYGLGLMDPRLLITDVETLLMQDEKS